MHIIIMMYIKVIKEFVQNRNRSEGCNGEEYIVEKPI